MLFSQGQRLGGAAAFWKWGYGCEWSPGRRPHGSEHTSIDATAQPISLLGDPPPPKQISAGMGPGQSYTLGLAPTPVSAEGTRSRPLT